VTIRSATAPWLGRAGCYVFALRNGQGYRPLYVGMTTRSFEVECFTDRNLRRLERFLEKRRGTLLLFLVAYRRTRGRLNQRSIEDLEKYLIRLAKKRNPDLLNLKSHEDPTTFVIDGIDTWGRPPKLAELLGKTLSL